MIKEQRAARTYEVLPAEPDLCLRILGQVDLHASAGTQHSTAQHSTAQRSTAQHSAAQHSTAQHDK